MGKILIVPRLPGTDGAFKRTEEPLLAPKYMYCHRWKRFSQLMVTDTQKPKAALSGGNDKIKPAIYIHQAFQKPPRSCFPRATGSFCVCVAI